MLNSMILLAVAALIGIGNAAQGKVITSLLEEASQQGYQSGAPRRLSSENGTCGLRPWCLTKKALKYAGCAINAAGEALDDLTEDAIDAAVDTAEAVADTLEAAAEVAMNVAVKTGQQAAKLADKVGTAIDTAVTNLCDELEDGIQSWAKNKRLDMAEDWFWPDQASKIFNRKYRFNNHHGRWIGYAFDIIGNGGWYKQPVHVCTACTPLADAIFKCLDSCYAHRVTHREECEGRAYLLQSEAAKLQEIADSTKKHVEQHKFKGRKNRLYVSHLYLQTILDNVEVYPDNDEA